MECVLSAREQPEVHFDMYDNRTVGDVKSKFIHLCNMKNVPKPWCLESPERVRPVIRGKLYSA